jgi:REP element-mobilizing transposase RayT
MPRRGRQEAPGAIHHAVAQGNRRGRIVEDDVDRADYETRIARACRTHGWIAHASCLLDTHHHLVVETAEPNLGIGLGRALGAYARRLNERHGREAHVFGNRFWSRRITGDADLLRTCVYAVVNPVAAGLWAHPREWRWCSFVRTADGDPARYAPGEERLLGMLGDTPGEARRAYAAIVDAAAEVARARRYVSGRELWDAFEEVDGLEKRVPG